MHETDLRYKLCSVMFFCYTAQATKHAKDTPPGTTVSAYCSQHVDSSGRATLKTARFLAFVGADCVWSKVLGTEPVVGNGAGTNGAGTNGCAAQTR